MPAHQFTDAIALLKADHRKVEDLFDQFEKARDKARKQKIVQQICTELKVHTTIEEELFYPTFRGKIEDDTLDEAYVEHDGAKVLVNDLQSASPSDEYYDAKVTVLAEEIRHHVAEEERPSEGMFAQVRKTDVDLVELRDKLMARKKELLEEAESAALPAAKPKAVKLVMA
ncbi:MAG TPA: hemerythrin domain-containing protein [Sphingomonadaceae bacterium]|nr:hemerythrin domain-containing protein [Sphingomonadaceae bacterium]